VKLDFLLREFTFHALAPNDGSEANHRHEDLIEPVGKYYVVNSTAFAIGYSVESTCATYTFAAPFVIPEQVAYTTRTITVPSTLSSVADINFNVNQLILIYLMLRWK
jgi:hypothetical protein